MKRIVARRPPLLRRAAGKAAAASGLPGCRSRRAFSIETALLGTAFAFATFAPTGEARAGSLVGLCRPIYEVTTTAEGDDPDALCYVGEPCTLRGALNTAAGCRTSGPMTIVLAPDAVYTLTRPDPRNSLTSVLTSAQEARVGRTALPRVFGTVTLRTGEASAGHEATIRRDSVAERFRLLHVPPGGALIIDRVKLENGAIPERIDSSKARGAGILNEGRLFLMRTTMTGHRGSAIPSSPGGAIFNSGSVVVRSSILSSNSASSGAALVNDGGDAEIDSTQLHLNRSCCGAASSVILQTSTGGRIVVSTSSLDGNVVDGAPFMVQNGVATLHRSTVSNNDGGHTGGIAVNRGDALIRLSTFDVNSASQAGAIACGGPAARLRIIDVTVTGNRIDPGLFGIGGLGASCGVELSNSVFAKNVPKDCGFVIAPVLRGFSADSDGSCRLAFTFVEPMLEALASVGGPTKTRRPTGGSPLINAGSSCEAIDQRGFRRSDSQCDIGAVERSVLSGPPLPPHVLPAPLSPLHDDLVPLPIER